MKISAGKAALLLGVSVRSIHRWGDEGRFGDVEATEGGHRRYDRERVIAYEAALQHEREQRLAKVEMSEAAS